jgi:dihydroorotase
MRTYVLVDMAKEHVLENEDIVSKAGWTPFAGCRVKGGPVTTILRGTVVAEDGKVVAEPGGGRFIPPDRQEAGDRGI